MEQHHVMDKIRALDDSFISVESGLVQRINALQIEAKNIQENLNRLQYIYFMTNMLYAFGKFNNCANHSG